MKKRLLRINVFYGWFIAVAGFLIMATAWGIIFNCASIFINPISESMGFKRSGVNLILTITMLIQMIVSLNIGKIYSRFQIKKLMQLSTFTISIFYFFYSYANSLYSFYIITIITSVSSALLTILPLSQIINNWFYEKRGLITAIVFMGSGIGGMVLNYFAGLWITLYGWRITYKLLALVMFAVLFPCTFLIIEMKPKDLYLEPLGKMKTIDISEKKINCEGVTFSEVKKTYKFWVLIMSLMIGGIAMGTPFFTAASHLNDQGYSLKFSANIVAAIMGSLAISKLILGQMFDKIGVKRTTLFSTISNTLGILGLLFSNYTLGLIFAILGIGLGNAFGTVGVPMITVEMFGEKDFSTIVGILVAATSFGGVVHPFINGIIFDITGSYNTSYIALAILSIGLITSYSIILPNEKRNEFTLLSRKNQIKHSPKL